MTSIFVVRPFNKKPAKVKGKDGKTKSVLVDFEQIHRSLIDAAVEKNGLECRTTGEIAEAGNIRVDMFQRLIAYDLVIADISIHNANAFYELGIRHGLRPKGTILLRFPTVGDDVPFDLKTDRYIPYDWEKPEAAVDLLAKSIQATIDAMRDVERKPDSPVFLLLDKLDAPDLSKLLIVPRAFKEAVEVAEHDGVGGGATLALLGEEAKRNIWGREGVRLLAHAELRKKTFEAARESWEFIRKDLPDDIEANLQLATIYQRLGDLVASSHACSHVLNSRFADRKHRADARSQLARNEKAGWVKDFKGGATEEARRQLALADGRSIKAFQGYMEGFAEDLNDYYSGINALGLLTAMVKLAEMDPDTWAGHFDTPRRAENELDDYREQLKHLRGAVRMSLDNAKLQNDKESAKPDGKVDRWLPPSEAQYRLLTAERRIFVLNGYQEAKRAGGASFNVASEAAQVAIFFRLGLFTENCSAAMEALGVTLDDLEKSDEVKQGQPRDRTLVATGHRADAKDRPAPRFPNTADCIDKAKAWLRKTIAAEKEKTKGKISGIGGAASGTDLLFHEVCEELGIPTKVVLPIPAQEYRRQSVSDGGEDWVEMFNARIAKNPPIILSNSAELPSWTKDIAKYGVFQRGNIWAMEDALLRPNADTTLIALWNGKAGDGPGGTADMVRLAEEHGAKICKENTDELFGLPKQP